MDILLDNPRENPSHPQPAMTFFPSDNAQLLSPPQADPPLPGANLEDLAAEQPKASEAVTIQRHFRGYLTRKWRQAADPRPPVPFDPQLHYLRTFDASRLFLPARPDLEAGDRYRLLGMNLPQLLAAAHSEEPVPSRETLPSVLLTRYSRLDPRLHMPADKLNWKVEESYANLEFRKKLNKSLARSASKSALSAQGGDLGYSDDFEDQAVALDSSRKKSSQASDSYIEDLAQSRSLSASRRQLSRRSRGPRRVGEELNRQTSILDNESSGFGFLQDQKQPIRSPSRLNTEQSEEDSNPFGVVRRAPQPPARKDSDQFHDSGEDLLQGQAAHRLPTTPRDKPPPKNKFREHQAPVREFPDEFGKASPKKLQPIQLDPKIYSEPVFLEPTAVREQPVARAGSQHSKLVADELQRMKAVVNELEELNALYSQAKMGHPHKGVVIKKMAENEALTKRLINKVMFAREQTWEFARPDQQPPDPEADLQHLVQIAVREALSELAVPAKDALQPLTAPKTAETEESHVGQLIAASGRPKPFDELYYRAAGSTTRLQSADRQSEEQYLTDLESRVRKLRQVEADFNDAAVARKAELEKEREKRERQREIGHELASRRREFAAKYDLRRFGPRTRPPAVPAESLIQPKPSGRSLGSAQASDYSESKEQLEISWIESEVSGKKTNKFTVYS